MTTGTGHLGISEMGCSADRKGGAVWGDVNPLPVLVYQIGLFISYDNATKQLDTVYDITPDLAQAFLERISSSSFDMRNTSTIHRQGVGALGPRSTFPRCDLSPSFL